VRVPREVALIAAVHAAACVLVLALGFDHVSDDDFARVTIAQSFARAPKLDPSGTSWLPFPFWALGSVMLAAGRSLAVARVASIALASLAATLPYLALRYRGASRGASLLAVAFATLSPWSLWLGASTVPESFTASFTAAAAIALGASPDPRAKDDATIPFAAQLGFALALLAACLSRYEPWPVAAVLALVLARRALLAPSSRPRGRELLLAAIVAFGPLAWLAWNAHAHGDALHFFQRVARFKRALGEGTQDAMPALALYPRLLVLRRPDVVLAAACALVTGRLFAASGTELRRRWTVPLACAAAQLAFLAYGNVRDGAPAHHPERALLGIVFVTAAFAADVLAAVAAQSPARARPAALGMVASLALSWVVNGGGALDDVPGTGTSEVRTAQIAAGKALAADQVEHVVVTPCSFEHFALIAAFGSPELVVTNPRTNAEVTASCPAVERR
jgi:hypothetical protein